MRTILALLFSLVSLACSAQIPQEVMQWTLLKATNVPASSGSVAWGGELGRTNLLCNSATSWVFGSQTGCAAGNTRLVIFATSYGNRTHTVADARGNTYIVYTNAWMSHQGLTLAGSKITTAVQAGDATTVSLNSSGYGRACVLDCYIVNSSSSDRTNQVGAYSTSISIPITPASSPTVAIGATRNENVALSYTSTDTWTDLTVVSDAQNPFYVSYKELSTTDATAMAGGWGSTSSSCGVVMTFK